MRRTRADTLVFYVYSYTDPEYSNNLRYFVNNGMRPDDGCHYIVVVQQVALPVNSACKFAGSAHKQGAGLRCSQVAQMDPAQVKKSLPKLPSNARYVHHANECFDWGTFG